MKRSGKDKKILERKWKQKERRGGRNNKEKENVKLMKEEGNESQRKEKKRDIYINF